MATCTTTHLASILPVSKVEGESGRFLLSKEGSLFETGDLSMASGRVACGEYMVSGWGELTQVCGEVVLAGSLVSGPGDTVAPWPVSMLVSMVAVLPSSQALSRSRRTS